MEPQLQRIEVEPSLAGDDDFAIEHAALRQLRLQRVGELREVPIEWLLVATLDEQLISVAEDERPKAVPLRLEDPAVAGWQLSHSFGEHGQDRRIDRKTHAAWYTGREGGGTVTDAGRYVPAVPVYRG